MQILFLNSSLEPGRDGVGDYVRLLAGACSRLGHRCAAVALYDSFVKAPANSTWEDGTKSVRLPSVMSWPQRLKLAGDFREAFRPDWISLQMVPYGFQKKGILSALVPFFRAFAAEIPLHIMFHELWVGAGRPSPLHFRVMGWLQYCGIRRLLTETRPRLVTTSNPVYAAMLRDIDVQAEILPLFGNVPIDKHANQTEIAALLPGTGIKEANRGEWWVGLFFGALHEQWKPEPFFSFLLRAARLAGRRVCLVSVGRSHGAQWNQVEKQYEREITFIDCGEQPVEIISALLQKADFGIAASPWGLIGKSGTVAAMLDHGLPVIVTRDDFHSFHRADRPPSVDPLVHHCDDQLEAKLLAGLPKRPPLAQVDEVAMQLCGRMHDLAASTP